MPCRRQSNPGLRRLACAVIVAALLLPNSLVLSQTELVLHKEGTKLYHRPGCPVVRDSVGVLAMARGQAEARGYKAHPECDPSTSGAPPASSGTQPSPVTVYADGDKYYHRKDCSRVRDSNTVKPTTLEKAAKSKWPCPTCKPPIRKKSNEPAVPGMIRRGH